MASPKKSDLSGRDSGGFEWEELHPPPAPSSEHAHLIPPSAEPPKRFCGYLRYNSSKGLKQWKSRWFVFNDQQCCLFYYSTRNELGPLGSIDISSATLNYDVQNMDRFQFEVSSGGRVHSLQASSKETMFYWLETLQKKRRKFSMKRKKADAVVSDGGLVAESSLTLSIEQEQEIPEGMDTPQDTKSGLSASLPALLRQRVTSLKSHRSQKGSSGPSGGDSSPNSQRRSNFYIDPPILESNEMLENGSHTDGTQADVPSKKIPVPQRGIASRRSFATDLLRKARTSFYGSPGNEATPCTRCQELQESVHQLEEDLSIKEREVKDRDEINEFLRSEIRMADMRTKVRQELMSSSAGPEDKKVDVLLQREQTITEMQRLLEEAIVEKDRLGTELEAKRYEVQVLGEQVSLFKEAVGAKDHVVMELTNKLFQLENKGQIPADPQDVMRPQSTQSLQAELQKMKETVEAYKQQNSFLSNEILELNALRTEDVDVYRTLTCKYHEMEARYYSIQSKYMILLQEAQEPKMDGVEVGTKQELVTRMLEEALKGEDQKDRAGSFDEYGFTREVMVDDIPQPLLVMKAKKMDQQAQRVYNEQSASQRARWDNFMATCGGGKDLQKSAELKQLIRSGMPAFYRSIVWQWCIREIVGRRYAPGEYQSILQQHAGQSSVAINQIELDLLRTLPTNKYYDKPDAQGIGKLRRVLVAYSWFDPAVGYCQGLNRLAAIALLFLDEEDAFWCLVAIVRTLLPSDYYDKTLLGSQTDQRVLRDLLLEKVPKLSAHLTICDIDFSLITFNWFHTIYVDNLPVETMLRIWDTFLYEGSKVLFRFAIAVFKYYEEELLGMENSIQIFNRLRTMCQDATDINRLAQIAFYEINPFPMKTIDSRRIHHRQQIKAELEELDAIRSQGPPAPSPPAPSQPTCSKDVDSDEEIPPLIHWD